MDLDAFVAAHAAEWQRLEALVQRAGRPRRLGDNEVDELVRLYQLTATHLSVVRSASPDAGLIARLSRLVARARAVIAGSHDTSWQSVARFATVTFPLAVYHRRYWAVASAVGFLLVAFGLGAWVASSPHVQAELLPPETVRRLVQSDFAGYYRSAPASSFAAQVWTNNAWVAAGSLVLGVAFGLPTVLMLLFNAANVGIQAGYLVANDRTGLFFGLILPHGMLELTAVFIAAGTGLRLGWRLIDPGPLRRGEAIAREARSAVPIALGLTVVLLISGMIEAFVTPSGLPTWARILIGAIALLSLLVYVTVFGRRAAAHDEESDLPAELRGDVLPVAG